MNGGSARSATAGVAPRGRRALAMVSSASGSVGEAPSSPRHLGWRDQLRRVIDTVDALDAAVGLTPDERCGAERAVAAGFPLRITPYYASLIDRTSARCPIRRQVVPRAAEQQATRGDMVDPLGEEAHEVAPSLVRRYPDRALLVATDQCAIYCRFCTRSRVVGGGAGPTPMRALEPAFQWIEAHPEVRDVILSGGDPLTLGTPRLVRLVARIRAIEHVDVVRLATRVPVSLPMRIDDDWVAALRPYHPLWVMTHFNHPRELTPEAAEGLRRLVDGGFPVMNQTVLLRGVNDDAATLTALFRGLVRRRVKPYYLLQTDPVRGTGHLRTPLSRGIALMEALQGRLSGIALPKLIVDTPGGMGKVPVGPDYIVARGDGWTRLRTHRGVEVDYLDP
ncbi:MAG: KamA family radical SAM protein [Myxococcota bacterium]